MFITVKRKVIIAVLVAVVVAITACSLYPISSAVAGGNANGITVVIDAGHGGIDGGVVGLSSGAKESDVNLSIAKSLAHFLKKGGFNVVMTRSGYGGLYDSGKGSKKLSDMKKRSEIINEAKPDLMISLHQNSYPLKSVKGAQVFYDAKSEKSQEIAKSVQNVLNDSLGASRVEKSAEYYVLQCSPYPSVLVECGFLSNPEEERLLITSEYQEKVAHALYTAICVTLLTKNDQNLHERE